MRGNFQVRDFGVADRLQTATQLGVEGGIVKTSGCRIILGSRKNDAIYSRPQGCCEAHWAGFARGVKN